MGGFPFVLLTPGMVDLKGSLVLRGRVIQCLPNSRPARAVIFQSAEEQINCSFQTPKSPLGLYPHA